MNFKISDTFVDCPAGTQKRTCTGIIDFPRNYKCTVIDFGDGTEPRSELNITSSPGYSKIKKCVPGGKFYIRMLRSFGEPNETQTHLIWYPKRTSNKGNFIPSDAFQIFLYKFDCDQLL